MLSDLDGAHCHDSDSIHQEHGLVFAIELDLCSTKARFIQFYILRVLHIGETLEERFVSEKSADGFGVRVEIKLSRAHVCIIHIVELSSLVVHGLIRILAVFAQEHILLIHWRQLDIYHVIEII